MDNKSSCCCGTSNCCSTKQDRKQLVIDFLYLDLSICERCQGTEESLEEAISTVSTVLNAAGYDIVINGININTKALAIQYEFISSPTIRINGRDIANEMIESECKDCGDLCGDNVDCRVWSYEGVEYTKAPKELIINEILKEVYAVKLSADKKEEYQLPENLDKYFTSLDNKM